MPGERISGLPPVEHIRMKMKRLFRLLWFLVLPAATLYAQPGDEGRTPLQNATLQDCIQYGLAHQPLVKQSSTNEEIAQEEIRSKLADWFPQINFSFNLQHNYRLPTSIFQGNPVRIGLTNTSSGQFSVTQTLFDRDVLLAASTAGDVRKQAAQTTAELRINAVVNISKAYYAVLLTQNQIELANEDIARLDRSARDSYSQYENGVVDKTDYMQATIALNNGRAELKQDQEQLSVSYANLKALMGYPPTGTLTLHYDTTAMENDISIDTTAALRYGNRIEYDLLLTDRRLQEANLHYHSWSFLPSLSAFGAYNLNYQNDALSQLYLQNYPNSFVGLQLTFPIFQGGKRIDEIEQARLQLKLIDDDQAALENSMQTEYTQALAAYKSNLNAYLVQKDNLGLAKDVYATVELQYKSGIKKYLDVITAETNLRTTQTNFLNSLYQVLISKMDLQKALGTIPY